VKSTLAKTAAILLAVVTTVLLPGLASAADNNRSCFGHVTAAGVGQWVRYRPVESGHLAYQLQAGQQFEFHTLAYDAVGIRWRNVIPDSTNTALPMFLYGNGGTRFIQIDVCDTGCGVYVCRQTD